MANTNQTLRKEATGANIYLWQIADKMGITDSHFSRLLRKELSGETKDRAFKALSELKEEQS